MLFLIDASRANNEQKTGVEWYAYFVIQKLKKIVPNDWQVILYSREKLKGDLADLPVNWQEKVLNWPPRRLWTQLRLSWEMLKFRQRSNAILFVPAHVLPLICPPKTLITIHDLGGLRFPQGYSFFERFYSRFASFFALKKAIIITPSNFVKEEIKYIFKKENVETIYNGFDNELFKENLSPDLIEKVKTKYGLGKKYFLTIGRLEEKKNTIGIIQAFNVFKKNNPNFQLLLLGKPGFGFEAVKQEAENSPWREDIIFPGWVEEEDVPYLMAGAEAFVFPSFYEGFGIPIAESFAVGTPVITSNIASMPEISQGAALLVNPYRPIEIAKALEEIVKDENLKKDLIAKGLFRAKDFSWEGTAREIYKVVLKLIK